MTKTGLQGFFDVFCILVTDRLGPVATRRKAAARLRAASLWLSFDCE
jgi:hypothetical protein